ncbi:MAG: M36 family metallopeptidase, partial [Acidobacteriota bacterium]
APEPRGLSEGLSDYFALTAVHWFRLGETDLQEEPLSVDEKVTFGEWVGKQNLRRRAYDASFVEAKQDAIGIEGIFDRLDQPAFREPHEIGELWCAILMAIHRRLSAALDGDWRRAHELGWRTIYDSLLLLEIGPSGPGLLHARDAVREAAELLADELEEEIAMALSQAIDHTFIDFHMGSTARGYGIDRDGIEGSQVPWAGGT